HDALTISDSEASTVDKSNSTTSEYSGSSLPAVKNMLFSSKYFLTNSICSSERPVKRKYFKDSSSTGKKPQVAPYSGAMFAIVALSANGKCSTPGPKNSTNLPTTPFLRNS